MRETRISLSVDTGKLYVYSDPSGADVFIGNEKKGQTPLKITYLNSGEYEISISKKFYKNIKRKVMIENKKSKVIFSNLERGTNSVEVLTIPSGAEVELSSAGKKNSPAQFKTIPSGYYNLKVSMAGYHDLAKKIVLNPGDNFIETYELKKIQPGFLYIERLPKYSHVKIKNSDKPFYQGMELMPGKYMVEIVSQFDEGEVLEADIIESTETRLYAKPEKGARVFISSSEKDLRFFLVNEKKEFISGSFLKKGKYKIALLNSEYEDFSIEVDVKPGKDIEKTINPVKKGRLFVDSNSDDMKINIKGVWDKFEQGIFLAKGSYEIEIISDKFPTTLKNVQIENGKDTRIEVNPGEFVEPETGMKFLYVKGGCFEMGCFDDSICEGDEKPAHTVCVDGFWMGVFEVTQGEWTKVMKTNPSGYKNGDNYPVEKISWHQAVEFARKLSELSTDDFSFRLPTEAEWEYAARSFGINEEFAGGINIESLAWYENNSKSTMPVGTKEPNYLGLYDMTGNVWEWCLDSYDPFAYRLHVKNNPVVTKKVSSRVFRGGSWYTEKSGCYVTNRAAIFSGNPDTGIGMRLVRVKELHLDKN